jgi:threonine synthase
MRRRIWAVSIDDQETKKTLGRVYADYGVLLEPHGAVGWRGLELYRERCGDKTPGVVLETAHPAKFPNEIKELLGFEPELPRSMQDIDRREGTAVELPAVYARLKAYLLGR